MPSMPKWLGDFSEKIFKNSYRETIVSEVEYYHKNLKRVRYQGEILKNIEWTPAQEIEFRVNNTDYRHYTPAQWNAEEGYVDVIFYLHGQGVGSLWADNIKVGDKILLIGPAGKFVLNAKEKDIIMMGDETTLGAFYGMQRATANRNIKTTCILEMNTNGLDWHNKVGLNATILPAEKQRGKVLLEWLKKYIRTSDNYRGKSYYLSGNADTIRQIKHQLILADVSLKVIYTKPYWLEGKKGL